MRKIPIEAKRILLIVLVLPLLAQARISLAGETPVQERRIEEEKREELAPTIPSAERPPELPSAPSELGAPPPPLASKEIYLFQLAEKRIAYGYDAAKAISLLMGVDEQLVDLDSQVSFLREKQLLPSRLQGSFNPMDPLRRGVAAHIFQKALGIRGGIALRLLGPSERYALKELVFQGIMSPGLTQDLVSGAELVQILDQATRYKLQTQGKSA